MELGFFAMNTDFAIRPEVIAPALEQRGFASMWVGEHSHIPASRQTPYPGGGELPKGYWHLLDPFVSLGAAATVTSRLRLGTGVCLVLEHDLLALAKAVATLDFLSNGRIDLGVGVGWNREELANHTTIPFRKRYRALREHIAALRQIWSREEASYAGEFVQFEALWSDPKPVQQPNPPVWFGAAGKLGMAHSAEWADGWCPIDTGFRDVAVGIERFRAEVGAAGRDPDAIPITLFVMGRADTDKLRRYRDLGIHAVVLGTAGSVGRDLDRTLPVLDEWAALIPELRA
jgi:probable F420-dependent oxidoreductase